MFFGPCCEIFDTQCFPLNQNAAGCRYMKLNPTLVCSLIALPAISFLSHKTGWGTTVRSVAKSPMNASLACPHSLQRDQLTGLIDDEAKSLYAPKGVICEPDEPLMQHLYISGESVVQANLGNPRP